MAANVRNKKLATSVQNWKLAASVQIKKLDTEIRHWEYWTVYQRGNSEVCGHSWNFLSAMRGFDDISQRVHPQLVLTSLRSPATQGRFVDNFRDFTNESVEFRKISTTQGSSLTLMTSLRTRRSSPIIQLSSPITQGAFAYNDDEVVDNSWKFVNKSEDCSNTGEVAEKSGKFSDDPEELNCIQGSLNDFV